MSLTVMEAKGTRLRAPSAATTFFLAAFAFILADLSNGQITFHDNDDIVRFLQIRDLLGDDALFDLTLPFISMPEPYVSHYSRIVDLPYYLIGKALMPVLGLETALLAATWAWPLVMLAAFCALTLHVVGRIAPGRFGWQESLLTALALTPAILEFAPSRIDHHNVQLVLMMAIFAGLVGPARAGGIAMGAAAAVSVAVGLESLPYIVATLGGLTLAAVFGFVGAQERLQAAGLSLALFAAPAAALSFGPDIVLQTQCDIVSAPWLAAMAGAGVIVGAAPALWRLPALAGAARTAIALRLASLAVPGVLLVATLALVWQQCALGHYDIVDPLSRALWLDRLPQEHSILHQFATGRYHLAVFCVLWGCLLIAAWPLVRHSLRNGGYQPAVIYLAALAGLALFLMLDRSMRLSAAPAALFLPAAVALMRGEAGAAMPPEASRRWLVAALGAPLILTGAVYLAVPKIPFVFTVTDQLHFDRCAVHDAGVFDGIEPSRIMAPLGMAVRIASEFPQHSVATFTVHRAAPGMRRMFTAFTTHDAAARAEALAPFDYLAACVRDFGYAGLEDVPLFAALVKGETVPGLVPVGPHSTSMRLYRIDRAALR